MKKIVLFVLCGWLALWQSQAQFVVYYASGIATKAAGGAVLKKGDVLAQADVVLLGAKSSLMLVCANYKVIQLKGKRRYALKTLQAQCVNTAAGYTASYFQYVWNQFSHPHGSPEKDPEAFMKNVGAVSRGCSEMATAVWMDSVKYGRGSMPVYWKSVFSEAKLAIYAQPFDGDPLRIFSLQKDEPFDLQQVVKHLDAGSYYWVIQGTEPGQCERRFLQILSPADYQVLLQTLIKAVPETTAAETAFATAFVLQENHLLSAAFQYYSKAAQLEPGNALYKQTLAKFYEVEM